MILAFVTAFTIHFYREGNRDEEFLERMRKKQKND
jgi:hypothetical protein